MKISVFTPTHNPKYIQAAYESLLAQDTVDWEWVLLLNNGAKLEQISPLIQADARVLILQIDKVKGVGEAKGICCEHAKGEILVELDHDDELGFKCLEKVSHVFHESPEVVFVYSNTGDVTEDMQPSKVRWNPANGWRYTEHPEYTECHSFGPHPHNVSLIWFAPNHVRAFRKSAYDAVGGYDRDMVVLDDQDLMCRLYTQGEFFHIPEVLYLQRQHSNQTQVQSELNARIQFETLELHNKYITDLCLAWSKRNNLLALDMGAAHRKRPGFAGCDIDNTVDVDHCFDASKRWPFDNNTVGVIRAVDFMEHVEDKVHLIKEMYRVLAPGGMILSMTPSTDGRGAYQDPTHVAFYNENSFFYYVDRNFNNFVRGLNVRFQKSRIFTDHPTEWHKVNNVPYVHAHLIAVKDDKREYGGALNI